jgi:hypothetical protein
MCTFKEEEDESYYHVHLLLLSRLYHHNINARIDSTISISYHLLDDGCVSVASI